MTEDPMTLGSNVLLVGVTPEQLIEFRHVLHAQLDHPARAVGIPVDERWIALEGRVPLGDGACHRRVQLRHGLRSRRTATGSGSSERKAKTPGRPGRSHACSTARAAAAVATIASGSAPPLASARSSAAALPAARCTLTPASV